MATQLGMMLKDHSAVLEARDHETATRRQSRLPYSSRSKRTALIPAKLANAFGMPCKPSPPLSPETERLVALALRDSDPMAERLRAEMPATCF
jgi:hypothetical protein